MKKSKIQKELKKMLDDEKHLKYKDMRDIFSMAFYLAGAVIVASGILIPISILWTAYGIMMLIAGYIIENRQRIKNIEHFIKYKNGADLNE